MQENRSLREVNLSLKHEHGAPDQRQPMFFSKYQQPKVMIRAQFFLINRNADPTFLFQALLHELPSFDQIFTLNDQTYQVKDYTRTLIPGRDPGKVREGDVRILVMERASS